MNKYKARSRKKNKYGLSRYIPADIKLKVRQASKFGCVICRNAIYEYEHIIPEFKEAKEHAPERICLLCSTCHAKVTKRMISKEQVLESYKHIKTNTGIEGPFDSFNLTGPSVTFILGGCKFEGAKALIKINGEEVLSIRRPEEGSNVPRINGKLFDLEGRVIIKIVNNEWQGNTDNWDSTIEGNEFTIKTKDSYVALKMKIHPPSTIEILELNMQMRKAYITIDKDGLAVGREYGPMGVQMKLKKLYCYGPHDAICINTRAALNPLVNGFRVNSDGITINGTGVSVGVGGNFVIPSLEFEKVFNIDKLF